MFYQMSLDGVASLHYVFTGFRLEGRDDIGLDLLWGRIYCLLSPFVPRLKMTRNCSRFLSFSKVRGTRFSRQRRIILGIPLPLPVYPISGCFAMNDSRIGFRSDCTQNPDFWPSFAMCITENRQCIVQPMNTTLGDYNTPVNG